MILDPPFLDTENETKTLLPVIVPARNDIFCHIMDQANRDENLFYHHACKKKLDPNQPFGQPLHPGHTGAGHTKCCPHHVTKVLQKKQHKAIPETPSHCCWVGTVYIFFFVLLGQVIWVIVFHCAIKDIPTILKM